MATAFVLGAWDGISAHWNGHGGLAGTVLPHLALTTTPTLSPHLYKRLYFAWRMTDVRPRVRRELAVLANAYAVPSGGSMANTTLQTCSVPRFADRYADVFSLNTFPRGTHTTYTIPPYQAQHLQKLRCLRQIVTGHCIATDARDSVGDLCRTDLFTDVGPARRTLRLPHHWYDTTRPHPHPRNIALLHTRHLTRTGTALPAYLFTAPTCFRYIPYPSTSGLVGLCWRLRTPCQAVLPLPSVSWGAATWRSFYYLRTRCRATLQRAASATEPSTPTTPTFPCFSTSTDPLLHSNTGLCALKAAPDALRWHPFHPSHTATSPPCPEHFTPSHLYVPRGTAFARRFSLRHHTTPSSWDFFKRHGQAFNTCPHSILPAPLLHFC